MDPPVGRRLPRRQFLLFLIAILVPCLALVTLGLRLIAQERQLAEKRRDDDRQLAVVQVRQALLLRLEGIKLQEVATTMASVRADAAGRSRPAEVAFVGRWVDGGLRLPWEDDPGAQRFRSALSEAAFATAIRQAESAELVTRQYDSALLHCDAALAAAGLPAQVTYARLLRARVLGKLGRRDESHAEYEAVLASDAELVDEHGVPLSFYAAPPLLAADLGRNDVLERLRLVASGGRWLSPAGLYLARDLAASLGAADVQTRLALPLHDAEQAEALQRDAARLLATSSTGEPTWIAHGDPTWLVSLAPATAGRDGLVVAVRAAEILASLSAPTRPIRLAPASEVTAPIVGESFPGLRVMLPEPDAAQGSRQAVLVVGLALALALAGLAGHLLWRDVRRERRLAEMRSQFVSSVTHELKTPLTAIRMFTETLRLDEDVDRRTRSEYLDTILHESERLSRLVDNVLDFGKIERGKRIYRFEPVRLEDVVEGAARTLQHPLERSGFALDVVVDRQLPPVPADADALRQAVLNLLANAMKYSGDSRRIRLGLDRQNGAARIQVVDHGIGIALPDQLRVLERFYRAPTAENQHIPGAGLGLTLVAHIASAHGGAVEIESRPGSGSTFTIRLPLPDAGSAGTTPRRGGS